MGRGGVQRIPENQILSHWQLCLAVAMDACLLQSSRGLLGCAESWLLWQRMATAPGPPRCGKRADGLEPGGEPLDCSICELDAASQRGAGTESTGVGVHLRPTEVLAMIMGSQCEEHGDWPRIPPRVPAFRPSSQGLSKFSRPHCFPVSPGSHPPLKQQNLHFLFLAFPARQVLAPGVGLKDSSQGCPPCF